MMDKMTTDLRLVLVKGLQVTNEALQQRLEECEDLLAAYAVDEYEAFPAEVDGYFRKYSIKSEREGVL